MKNLRTTGPLRQLLLPCVLLGCSMASGQSVSLAPKVMLDGAFVEGLGLMRDDLRNQDLVPLQEPYSGMLTLLGGAGGESTTGTVLAITGPNAVVDWVLVELRSPASAGMVIASQCALVQRDGDIVGTDGNASLSFPVAEGDYHVAVRHRNHLAVSTAAPVPLDVTPSALDFSLPTTAVSGSNARKVSGAVALLWAGDVNADGMLLYTGNNNDRDLILAAIGGTAPTNVLYNEYRQEDVNMDGAVKYFGQNNDRDIILQNIGGVEPTATIAQQAPQVVSTPGGGVVDEDGNSYTTIVLINGQEWMAENLRTTTYANGDPIAHVTGPWNALTTGAWVHYNNDDQYEVPYGNLYNWYAAADPRNACPTDWHVPAKTEWHEMELLFGVFAAEWEQGFLGTDQNVGGKMKTTSLWNAPNTGATNESGFSGRPGGYRSGSIGIYAQLGDQGHWWTASETSSGMNGHTRILWSSYASIIRNNVSKKDGYSVRCLRD